MGSVASTADHGKALNMAPMDVEPPGRIPLEEVFMRMAEELAKRSTCSRTQVGTVITTGDLTQVLGIGYNGNARGLPDACDSDEPGRCGCIHSEANALIKAGAQTPGKLMFVTISPCVMCAKMIVNSNVRRVYYRSPYRDGGGVEVLRRGGVETCLYDRWRELWR
jgi:dCMP deaminase